MFFDGKWSTGNKPEPNLANESPSGLIRFWEIILSLNLLPGSNQLQVLRLGPMPSSRVLEEWLKNNTSKHVLITENEIKLACEVIIQVMDAI